MAIGAIGMTVAGWFGASVAASSIVAGVIGGAIVGAAIGGLTALVTGGDIGKGLLVGAIGGAVTGGISNWMSGGTLTGSEVLQPGTASTGAPGAIGEMSAVPKTIMPPTTTELGSFTQKDLIAAIGSNAKETAMWSAGGQAATSMLGAVMAPDVDEQLELKAGSTRIDLEAQKELQEQESRDRLAEIRLQGELSQERLDTEIAQRKEELERPYTALEEEQAKRAKGLGGISTKSFLEQQLEEEAL